MASIPSSNIIATVISNFINDFQAAKNDKNIIIVKNY